MGGGGVPEYARAPLQPVGPSNRVRPQLPEKGVRGTLAGKRIIEELVPRVCPWGGFADTMNLPTAGSRISGMVLP
jgi:hypothetical protein